MKQNIFFVAQKNSKFLEVTQILLLFATTHDLLKQQRKITSYLHYLRFFKLFHFEIFKTIKL